MSKYRFPLTLFSALAIAAAPGCGADSVEADPSGAEGCTIVDLGDGTSAIRCAGGIELVVKNGEDGASGKDGAEGSSGQDGTAGADAEPPCTLAKNADGTHTMTCGDKSVVVGDACEDGFPGDLWVTHPEGGHGYDLLVTLFQVTSCTWVRGSVFVDDYWGKTLPSALARITEIDGSLVIGYDFGTEEL